MSRKADVKIRPVVGRVLLQVPSEPEMQNVDGIFVVRGGRKQGRGVSREALVKALPDNYRGQLAVGDRVLVPPWPDREVRINGDDLIFMDEAQIACVLE